MIWILSGLRIGGEARALRFLMLFLCGWIAIRAIATWNPAAVPVPTVGDALPWAMPPPFPVVIAGRAPPKPQFEQVTVPLPKARRDVDRLLPRAAVTEVVPRREASGGWSADRHALRVAMIARFFPQLAGQAAAFPARTASWASMPPAAPVAPGQGQPFWIQRQLAGWSLGGWAYLRQGSDPAPNGISGASQLGGSQAGLRVAYGFGDSGRLRAYSRATVAIAHPKQRELAFGLAFAPAPRLPLDVAVEQRVAAGSEGRTALAAMVTGGVSDVALPAGLRLDAYAQAGLVGARRRDGFADGAVVVDRRLGEDEHARLRLGALAAGAVQPGAARVDIGPRLTLRLPEVGKGSRVALDWRQRIAGDAQPDSGVALTLATDF